MTDSPSPNNSSFDISDVATPCTVIAARPSLRNQRKIEEEESEDDEDYTETFQKNETDYTEPEELSSIYVDDFSKEFSECDSSVMEPLPKPNVLQRTITKVYYHVDDEPIPYTADVHVPSDCIRLEDIKRKLPRTNFKYYCIALDPDSGLEVKEEIRDDKKVLLPVRGRFELYLLTIEGSVHSDNSSGRHRRKPASSKGSSSSREYLKVARHFDNHAAHSDNESEASSIPVYVKKAHAFNRRQQGFNGYNSDRNQQKHKHHPRHHYNHYEESTFDVTGESDYNYRDGITYFDADDDDCRSINTDLTSVSQVHYKQRMREKEAMRNKFRKLPSMSYASSTLSSITESSMGLEVITVRLNIQKFYLGMTPIGQTNARGQDAGLYVGEIHKGGAVALDGRIEVGDLISEINGTDLSNYSTDAAVNMLRNAVTAKQYVTLTIVKTSDARKNVFPINPRAEPTRPIDTNEWLKYATNDLRAMPSISSESSTPLPDEWVTNSSASGTPFGGGPPSIHCLTVHTHKKDVVQVMAAPGSGLEIKDRHWLKLPIPMSFLGANMIDWLLDHVQGLKDRKQALAYAGDMLKAGYIEHVVNKKKFSENLYYVMGEECKEYTILRAPDGGYKYPPSQVSSASGNGSNNNIFPPSMYPPPLPPSHRQSAIMNSIGSGYASMSSSPLPTEKLKNCGRTRDDQRSQASGSSRGSSKRYVELPRKPASLGSGSGISDHVRVASRSSFRAAMSGDLKKFTIDG